MPTRTLTGIATIRNPANDSVTGIATGAELQLVTGAGATTFSHTLLPILPGDDAQTSDIQGDFLTTRIDGQVFGDGLPLSDPQAEIISVQWTQNGQVRNTTVLNLFFENYQHPTLGNGDGDFIFFLEGDIPPSLTTVAQWNAFEATITSVTNPMTGTFAPNQPIQLSALGGTVTDNDRVQGTAGNDTIETGAGDDQIEAGDGNDSINPGDNTNFDQVNAGAGNDTVNLSDMTSSNAYVDIMHYDLNAGINAQIDTAANTATVDKGNNGTTQIINIGNPINNSDGGLGFFGTQHDDTITVSNHNSGWMQVGGGEGNDTFNLSGSGGTIRLSYSFFGATQGVEANLQTGVISNDGFGTMDTVNGIFREIRTTMNNDTVIGSDRNDSFILMAGNDMVDGADGFDRVRYDRSRVEAVTVDLEAGTATGVWRGQAFNHTLSNIEHVRGSRDGNDNIRGTNAGNELLEARAGNDTLMGLGGDDTIRGGAGNDQIDGGAGNDEAVFGVNRADATITANGNVLTITSSEGTDTVTNVELLVFNDQNVETSTLIGPSTTPTGGNDVLTGTAAAELISGLAGDDQVSGLGGNDTLYGGPGNDTLDGGAGDDLLGGSAGTDLLRGGDGNDNVFTAAGDDTAFGGDGNDLLGGAGGNDSLMGEAGNDALWGADGNDILIGGTGSDTLGGSVGNDSLDGGEGADELWGASGDDTILGGDGADILGGSAGNDSLSGQGDNDELWGADGNDTLDGGTGDDQLGAGAGDDQVSGGDGNDQVFGGVGNDTMSGGAGNDTLFGAAGDDRIDGGAGNDDMYAGSGADVLIFSEGADRGLFFSTTFDQVDLSAVASITDFTDLQNNHLSEVGGNAVIDDGAGNTLTLVGITQAGLAADDFIF